MLYSPYSVTVLHTLYVQHTLAGFREGGNQDQQGHGEHGFRLLVRMNVCSLERHRVIVVYCLEPLLTLPDRHYGKKPSGSDRADQDERTGMQ